MISGSIQDMLFHHPEKSSKNRYIRLENAKILNDKTLVFKISCSREIRTCFFSDKIFIQYDKSVNWLDSSILNIPAVSGLVTIAWAYGANLYVDKLDKTFLESLMNIQSAMAKLYPDFPMSKINVQNVVPHRFHNNKCGLLFSGGLDCITSYIKHRSEKPELIHVWGIDVRSDDTKIWNLRSRMLTNFSVRAGVQINVIRTNIREIVDEDFLHRKFGLEWWQNVSYGIVLNGLCAPLTCVTSINSLLFAAGVTSNFTYPSGEHPSIINNLSWGDTRVLIDNNELSRQLKIRYFLKDFTANCFHPFLKVCNKYDEPASNCGACEKCYRTIVGLVLEGIDPVKCGLNNVTKKTFEKIKERLSSNNFLITKSFVESKGEYYARMGSLSLWKDIQQHIPEKNNSNVHGSKDFLEWFRNFHLCREQQNEKGAVVKSPFNIAYYCAVYLANYLPKNIRIVTKQLLRSLMHRYEKFRWE
jgi:hypothetical protein